MSYKMARVYVGDVGTLTKPTPKSGIPKELDLSGLTFRQLCNLAVALGHDVRDIIGIDHCYEHYGMIAIGNRELPEGFNLFEHCSYCRNCWQTFRQKEAIPFEE